MHNHSQQYRAYSQKTYQSPKGVCITDRGQTHVNNRHFRETSNSGFMHFLANSCVQNNNRLILRTFSRVKLVEKVGNYP